MNAYKYKAYMETKGDISIIKKIIAEKEASIAQKKNEIASLEKEIAGCKERLKLAVSFKNELENGEESLGDGQEIDCHKTD